jgi:hypothetical protein
MTDINPFHPFTLEIQPAKKPGAFQWTLRKNGKLAQRSDRLFSSEELALKDGTKAVEQNLSTPAQGPG